MQNKFVKLGRGALMSTVAMAGVLLFSPVQAQEATEETNNIEEITVIGTRVKGRTAMESNVPVDIVTGDKLRNMGYTDTNSMLERVVPSINFRKEAANDTVDHQRPITMRGLPPGMALVLFNKQRHHVSALMSLWGHTGGTNSVNLDTIPALAIKRVEVLRDGAAAQYGADAIAGVINFSLQDAREGGQISVNYGQYVTAIDGLEELKSVTANNATGELEFKGTGEDVKKNDGETLTIDANFGLAIGEEGFFNISASYRDQNYSNRGGFDARQFFDKIEDPSTGDMIFDPREETTERYRMQLGQANLKRGSALYNTEVAISEDWKFFSVGSFFRQNGTSWGYVRRPKDGRNVVAIHPNGYTPLINLEITDMSLTNGLRGDIAGWETDISFYYGKNLVKTWVKNTLNRSYDVRSKTELYNGSQEQREWYANFNTTKLFEEAFMGRDLNVAFGSIYRKEHFEIKEGEKQSWATDVDRDANGIPILVGGKPSYSKPGGSQVLPGFSPENAVVGERDSIAFYVDLDSDITDEWNIGVAARFENYSDFGSTFNAKIATRYSITDNFNLRGAFSTGFMAPSLAQNYTQNTSTEITADGRLFDITLFSTTHDVAMALGAESLKATKSTNISLGFATSPMEGLALTVDFYQIKIKDQVVRSRFLNGNDVDQILADAGVVTQAKTIQFQHNAFDQRVRGIDVVLSYGWETESYGDFSIDLAYNYNQLKIQNISALPSVLVGKVDGDGDALELFSSDPDRIRGIETANPPHKLNASILWTMGNLSTQFSGTRYGAESQPAQIEENSRRYGSAYIFDLNVNYLFENGVSLSVGGMNLFDQYPIKDDPKCSVTGCSTWDRILPHRGSTGFGAGGRYIYTKVGYRF